MALPAPPIKNMTDFVVFAFVTIVTFVLLSAVIGLMLAVVFSDRDVSNLVAILADITTSLISALVGFLAGKGQGRAEVDEERRATDVEMTDLKKRIAEHEKAS